MKLLLAFVAVALLAVSCSALWHGDSDGGKALVNPHRVVAQKVYSIGDTGGGPKVLVNHRGDEGGGPKVCDVAGCVKLDDVAGCSKAKAYSKRRKAVYSEVVS